MVVGQRVGVSSTLSLSLSGFYILISDGFGRPFAANVLVSAITLSSMDVALGMLCFARFCWSGRHLIYAYSLFVIWRMSY